MNEADVHKHAVDIATEVTKMFRLWTTMHIQPDFDSMRALITAKVYEKAVEVLNGQKSEDDRQET